VRAPARLPTSCVVVGGLLQGVMIRVCFGTWLLGAQARDVTYHSPLPADTRLRPFRVEEHHSSRYG
jgi:hypothetical protein